ncbi:MAG TPA: hypothetical protein VKT78_18735 [Fimbriimonadaceae bacterium]|nr:hypothetical protein [Fimbriimonadaceae bacterium]
MADEFESQDWVRTGVSAAMLRSLDRGSPEALQSVADLLNSILPTRTRLELKGVFAKKLVKVSVTLGEDVMSLELDPAGGLLAGRVHMSRGIALKREEWPLADWIQVLVGALEARANEDARARAALKAWVGNP